MRTCPICDGTSSEPFSMKFGLPLRKCLRCSLVYLEKPHIKHWFDNVEEEFFSNGYLRHRDIFLERFLINKAINRLKVIQRFRTSGHLLDIGCGTGELVYIANKFGYKAEGLEYSQSLAEYGRTKYNVVIYLGELSDINFQKQYDIIVMSHVLEHTLDPTTTLRVILKLLSHDGILYIAVPNIACWEAKFRGWGSYEPYHIWYFNEANLTQLLVKVGYKVVNVHTLEPYSAWLNTIIRSALPKKYNTARAYAYRDKSRHLRILFLIISLMLNITRFISGLLLLPLRKIQEIIKKGEELIIIASPKA